jgi:hypothetical protein
MISYTQEVYVKFKTIPCTEKKPTRLCMEVLNSPLKGMRRIIPNDDWLQKQAERAGFTILFADGLWLYARKSVIVYSHLSTESLLVSGTAQLLKGL